MRIASLLLALAAFSAAQSPAGQALHELRLREMEMQAEELKRNLPGIPGLGEGRNEAESNPVIARMQGEVDAQRRVLVQMRIHLKRLRQGLSLLEKELAEAEQAVAGKRGPDGAVGAEFTKRLAELRLRTKMATSAHSGMEAVVAADEHEYEHAARLLWRECNKQAVAMVGKLKKRVGVRVVTRTGRAALTRAFRDAEADLTRWLGRDVPAGESDLPVIRALSEVRKLRSQWEAAQRK